MEIFSREIGELQTNCYIIKTPEGAVMIDPGDDVSALENFISDTNADISAIIITHGHFDHLLGAAAIKEKTGAKLYISEKDAPALSDGAIAMASPYNATPFTPVSPDGYLTQGKMSFCGIEFDVIATPGHTIGGMTLYCEAEKCVFSGDTLFSRGYGRTDFKGGSMMALVASLRKLFTLPDDVMVYSGHGESDLLGNIKKGYMR